MEEHAAATSGVAAVGAAPTRPGRGNDDDEMPLLFMDGLPSDFQRNAQLVALVTFMGSDDDGGADSGDDNNREGQHSAVMQRRAARRKGRNPYARGDGEEKSTEDRKRKKRDTGVQDLSLYLSMFNVSKE